VILSLEVHCGLAQQARMAAIMKEILGGAPPRTLSHLFFVLW
jgi:hypothetical protein